MDEITLAAVGVAAAVTVLGRRARPVAKLAMRGVLTATEATSAGRRGLLNLYSEVKTERDQRVRASATAAQHPSTDVTTAAHVTE